MTRIIRCVLCAARATHRAQGNPNYVVCKRHADRWDVLIAEVTR